MKLDSTISLPIADGRQGVLKGIHVTGQVGQAGSGIEEQPVPDAWRSSSPAQKPVSWCYLSLHNRRVDQFKSVVDRDGLFPCFVHKSFRYMRKKHGVRKTEFATISGLVFLQGNPRLVQRYLNTRFPLYHLVKDCSTNRPAVISHAEMEPFMRLLQHDPARVRLLLNPLRQYAGGNVRLRITSGELKGLEGYVVRIDRDRRLVLGVGNMTIAISGIHCEHFEVVDEKAVPSSSAVAPKRKVSRPERTLTPLQSYVDTSFFVPRTPAEVSALAENIGLWCERSELYLHRGGLDDSAAILFFLLDEVGHYLAPLFSSVSLSLAPVSEAVDRVFDAIDSLLRLPVLPDEMRQTLEAERDAYLLRYGPTFRF